LPVTRILRNVVGTDRPFAAESGSEDLRVARHAEAELIRSRSRQGIQQITFALVIQDVVEEGTELGARQLDACIRHHLDQLLQVEFRRDRRTRAVQRL